MKRADKSNNQSPKLDGYLINLFKVKDIAYSDEDLGKASTNLVKFLS